MDEALINSIVRRILTDPSVQSLLQGAEKEKLQQVKKPDGLVLLNYTPDLENVLTEVKKRWGKDFTLFVLPSQSVLDQKPALPEGLHWITAREALRMTMWKKILLPTCSANTLAKAALGLRDNPICEMIGRGIAQGISLDIVIQYLGLTPQTPKTYRALYEAYIERLVAYGVTIYTTLQDENPQVFVKEIEQRLDKFAIRPLSECAVNAEPDYSPEEIRFNKKFLGEKEIFALPSKSVLWVGKTTVISPLARDTLKLRQIELRQEMEVRR